MSARPRLLMIGLDAAEPALVERGIDDGTLPALRRLRAAGRYGRLASSAAQLAGSPWPSFFTGSSPARHGMYHFLQWRAAEMRLARPSEDWLPMRPFWRAFGADGPRCAVLDAPMTYAPGPFPGLEISGWASHDHLCPPASHPPGALGALRREFGAPPLGDEVYGPQRPKQLLAVRDELLEATRRVTEAALALARSEPWDLLLVGFAAPHRGGHKLWDASGARGEVGVADERALAAALPEVYRACDAAVARLVEAAGAGATTLVFSLHGMGPNTCRSEVLPGMLARVLSGGAPSEPETAPRGALARLRGAVPIEWRNEVKRRLPMALQDRLTTFWRTRRGGWDGVRAFCLPADLQGYVRLNLRGREARGCVAPGAEAQALCDEIADGIASFCDADSGEPLVAEITPAAQLFGPGPRTGDLPDLVVRWSDTPAARHRAVRSPRYGRIDWPTPGRNPDGRAGNHRGRGFLLAAGDRIAPGSLEADAHIVDLAPSACALLGVEPPFAMQGRRLGSLLEDG